MSHYALNSPYALNRKPRERERERERERLKWEAMRPELGRNTLLQVLDMRGNAVSPVGVKALEDSKLASKVADRQVLLPLATR